MAPKRPVANSAAQKKKQSSNLSENANSRGQKKQTRSRSTEDSNASRLLATKPTNANPPDTNPSDQEPDKSRLAARPTDTKPSSSKATCTKVEDTKSTAPATDSKPLNVKGNEKPSPSATSRQQKRKSSDFIEPTTVIGPDDSKRPRKGHYQGPPSSHSGHAPQTGAPSWSFRGNPGEIATFENGMRVTPGRGMMNQDYVGATLPLLEEFRTAGYGSFTAPWIQNGAWFYNECSDGTTRLSYEVIDFLRYIERDPSESLARNSVRLFIQSELRKFFPHEDENITVYGSDATGMGLPLSDIDLMIIAPRLADPLNPYKERENKLQALYTLQNHFLATAIASKAVVRDAHHPLLEIQDSRSGIDVDISFEAENVMWSLQLVQQWKGTYGKVLVRLVLLLKHALGMRKLGLGSATTPYEGGIGSYVIMCMVVGYLELRGESLLRESENGEDAPKMNIGTLLLDLLKFWGVEFDYQCQGLALDPPTIFPKSKNVPPWVFEVRDSLTSNVNLASATFGIRHVKETLKHFYNILVEEVAEFDEWRVASAQSWRVAYASKERGVPMLGRSGPAPAEDFGILGSIMAGKYSEYARRRRQIARSVPRRWASSGSLQV